MINDGPRFPRRTIHLARAVGARRGAGHLCQPDVAVPVVELFLEPQR